MIQYLDSCGQKVLNWYNEKALHDVASMAFKGGKNIVNNKKHFSIPCTVFTIESSSYKVQRDEFLKNTAVIS
jgi:hypothetical protein